MTTEQSKYPEYQHRYRASRPCPTAGYGSEAIITVDACLRYLQGNTLPYFSVTADITTASRRRNDVEVCGCMHREVLEYFPALAPAVALHLSDSTGAPTHAEANGWYQLAGYYGGAGERYHAGNGDRQHWLPDGTFNRYRPSTPEECLQSFADHVRLPVEECRALAESWRWDTSGGNKEYRTGKEIKAVYLAWVPSQVARWQTEADAVCALLDDLIARQAERRAAKETRV